MATRNNNEIVSKAKPHTVKKFELIKRYIESWAQKLLNTESCNGIIFIDCMCNSGVYTDINNQTVYGSPIRVAEVLTKAAVNFPHKSIKLYLNDYSQSKIDLLRKTICEKTDQGLGNVFINYSSIDGNQLLRDFSKHLNVANNLHYFLLYDPYQATIDWEALAPYFRYWGEVMINHMGVDTIRGICQVKSLQARKKYEDTYLIDDFKKLIPYGSNKNAYENRIAEIIEMLSRYPGRPHYYVAAFPFFNRTNSWLYDLIHCTGNIEGYKLYKQSAWKVFGDKSSTKNTHGDEKQFVLGFDGLGATTQTDVECLTVNDIAKYLQRKYAGKKISLDVIWDDLEKHPIFPSEGYRNEIKKALRETYGADTKSRSFISFSDRGL